MGAASLSATATPDSKLSISVDVCLMSGKRASLEVELDAPVQSLKQRGAVGAGDWQRQAAELCRRCAGRNGNCQASHVAERRCAHSAREASPACGHEEKRDVLCLRRNSWGRIGGDLGPCPTWWRQYRSSSRMSDRSKHHLARLLQSWVADLWSPGTIPKAVATAVLCRSS